MTDKKYDLKWLENIKPVKDATIKHKITTSASPTGSITFEGKLATYENEEYFETQQKYMNADSLISQAMKSGGMNQKDANSKKMQKRFTDIDYKIYSDCIIVDWDLTDGTTGEKIPYDKEICREVLSRLTKNQWQVMCLIFSNEENFTPNGLGKGQAVALGNESETT